MIATSTDIIEQPQPAGVSIRFKRLSLQGFKSFPDRAVLEFDHPVCAIVGPNGCGKSNILDALRWVLGEQGPSQLRAQNMSDVIFNGSATRKPVGLAEVSLTVEWLSDHPPHDYRDIEVTRRLYRSGESEYLLNRQPCRLKDIVDLFMDAGLGKGAYSLIEQGKVDALLLARPDERRGLIEQSAGIVKYKHRKKEAQSKLNLTEQNLDRVRDILGEVRSRRAVLARQARKAERFRELVRERDETRNAYLTARFAQSLRDRTALTTRLASLEDDAARLMAETALKAAAVEQARLRVDSATDALRAEQKNAEQNDMQLDFLTRRLADLHARSNALTRSSQDIESEQNELQGRRTESETSAEEKAAALSNIERSLQALEQDVDRARIEESRHQDTLTQLRKELRSLKDRELKCLELAARRRNQQIEYEEGLRRLRSRAEKLYRERDRVALEREQSGVAVRSTIASIRDLEESERGRIEELARCEDRIMARRRAVDERRGQIQAMDARLMECSSRARSLTDIIRAGEGLAAGDPLREVWRFWARRAALCAGPGPGRHPEVELLQQVWASGPDGWLARQLPEARRARTVARPWLRSLARPLPTPPGGPDLVLVGGGGRIEALVASPGGTALLAAGREGPLVRRWETGRGCTAVFALPAALADRQDLDGFIGLTLAAAGDVLLAFGRGGQVAAWQLADGRFLGLSEAGEPLPAGLGELPSLPPPWPDDLAREVLPGALAGCRVTRAARSEGRRWLALAGERPLGPSPFSASFLWIQEVDGPGRGAELEPGCQEVTALCFLGEDRLVVGGDDGELKLWSLEALEIGRAHV